MKEKDEKIKKYLDEYARSNKPDREEMIARARLEMRRKTAEKQKANRYRWVPIVAALSACFVFVLGLAIILPSFLKGANNDTAGEKVYTYNLSSLTGSIISKEDIGQISSNAVVLNGAISEKFKLFCDKRSGENILLISEYRYINGNNIEDVKVYAELTQNKFLYDNIDYQRLPIYNLDSGNIAADTQFEGGEYITKAYIKTNLTYCVSVMSPVQTPIEILAEKYLTAFYNN